MWLRDGRPLATLIGDVVGSRRAPDRVALHAALVEALTSANTAVAPDVPLRITVGDEFQGIFADIPAAVGAMLFLRLQLLPTTDTRYGIGWGPVQVLDAEAEVLDGPGWWSARAAIERASAEADRRRTACVRARFGDSAEPGGTPYVDGVEAPLAGLVNTTLRTLDELVGALSDLDARLILGTFGGRTQAELAGLERITQSAVSQRLARDGAWALLEALRTLSGPPG